MIPNKKNLETKILNLDGVDDVDILIMGMHRDEIHLRVDIISNKNEIIDKIQEIVPLGLQLNIYTKEAQDNDK